MRTLTVLCAAALAALAVACQKDDNTVDLTAVVADRPDSGAKVYIDGLYGCWQQGDAVTIYNGSSADNYPLAVTSADGVTATISGVAQGDNYTAGYPAANTTVTGPRTLTIELPAVQTYESAAIFGDADGAAQRIVSPMAAYSTGDMLKFYNVGALLKVVVSNTIGEALTLYAVEVESDNAPLSGTAAVTATAEGASISTVSGTGKSVTLSLSGAGVTLDASTGSATLYIPVLPIAENAKSNLTVHVKATGASGKYTFHGESAAAEGVWIAQNQIGTVPVTLDEGDKTSVDAYFWGKGTEECPFIIETEEDLYNLRTLTNSATSRYCGNSVYYLQTADLDISSQTNWGSSSNYAVGNTTNPFKAHYDGGGHAVKLGIGDLGSNVSANTGLGLFSTVGGGGSISNLTATGSIAAISRNIYVGPIAGHVTGAFTFDGCRNEITLSTSSSSSYTTQIYGGICGYINASDATIAINKCSNNANVTRNANGMIGGLCGEIDNGNVVFTADTNNGTITGNGSGSYYIGGICGYCKSKSINFSQCANQGSVVAKTSGAGGILGYAYYSATFTSCSNSGELSSTSYALGGMVGLGTLNKGYVISIDNCTNSGSIAGTYYVGGLVGNAYNDTVKITNSTNSGSISGTYNLGGLVGRTATKITISDCNNTGAVTANSNASTSGVAGILGKSESTTVINRCTNSGTVTAKAGGANIYAAGILGVNIGGTVTISDCGNNAEIAATNCFAAAGIVGQIRNGGGATSNTINNSYNKGDIKITTKTTWVGGICTSHNNTKGTVTNCFFSGSFTGSGTKTNYGDIASFNGSNNKVTSVSCYSLNRYNSSSTNAVSANYTISLNENSEYVTNNSSAYLVTALNNWQSSNTDYSTWSPTDNYTVLPRLSWED